MDTSMIRKLCLPRRSAPLHATHSPSSTPRACAEWTPDIQIRGSAMLPVYPLAPLGTPRHVADGQTRTKGSLPPPATSDIQHRNLNLTSVHTLSNSKVTAAHSFIATSNTNSIKDASQCVNMSKTMASSLSPPTSPAVNISSPACTYGPTCRYPLTASTG